jgi:hypothetical protein
MAIAAVAETALLELVTDFADSGKADVFIDFAPAILHHKLYNGSALINQHSEKMAS